MHSFKRKDILRIAQIFLLLLLLWGGEKLAEKIVVSNTWAKDFRQDVQTLVQEKEPVDMILVGASRVYRSFVPQILEDHLGLRNVLNAGSSAQGICGSYFMLKDLLETFTPEYVLVGVTWDGLELSYMQGDLIIMDRISPLQRIPFAMAAFPDKLQYASYITRLGENKDQYVDDIIGRLRHREEVKSPAETDCYVEKGFVYSDISCAPGSFQAEKDLKFDAGKIKPDVQMYLDKIVSLCQERGITCYFVSGPTSLARIYATDGYQNAVDYYNQYAAAHGSKYFNLNYLVGRESFLPDDKMSDINHVNGEGAQETTLRLAEILKKEWAGENTSGYFYKNLKDLQESVERIVAADVQVSRDCGIVTVQTGYLGNEDIIPEYRVLISADGEAYRELFPFSTQTLYQMEAAEDQTYKIRVEVRRQGNTEYDVFAVVLV